MRATAATLALAFALMGVAPTLAFCQAMCLPAGAQAAHQAAATAGHHHPSQATGSHATDSVLKDNAACKTLAQVALLSRPKAVASEHPVDAVAAADIAHRGHEVPAISSSLLNHDRHGPPVTAPPSVPLRV